MDTVLALVSSNAAEVSLVILGILLERARSGLTTILCLSDTFPPKL
jgi:hypothetical protein